MDMQALIEEMSALIVKIKSGTATQGELEAFAAAAGELNERAIILRYKSYEAKVFGTPTTPVAEPASETKTESTALDAAEPEIVNNESTVDAPFMAHSDEIENETENPEVSFDLFSMDDEIQETELTSEEPSTTHSDEIPVQELTSEEPISETEDGIGAEEEMEAPIIHEEVPGTEETTDETLLTYPEEEIEPAIIHMENESAVDSPFMAHTETETVSESETTTEPHSEKIEISAEAAAKAEIPSGDEHPVYKRLSNEDNSLAARLMAVRLETLKGAFGFNERLQIIKELFDGSNDEFTQAIERLDALDSKNEARHVVSNYARQYAWDKDSNLALEFVQKVERRYA